MRLSFDLHEGLVMNEKKNLPVIMVFDQGGDLRSVPIDKLVNGRDSIIRLTAPPPPGFQAKFNVVKADVRSMRDGGDLYKVSAYKDAAGKWHTLYGMSGRFLAECRAAGGVQCIASNPIEVKDIAGRGPGVKVTVVGILPSLVGPDRATSSSVQMSYQDAFERYGKRDKKTGALVMGDDDYARERTMLPRKLETMAKNRVTAELLKLRRAYPEDDLKTGLFAFVTYELDTNDETTRRIAIERMQTATTRLFGSAATLQPSEETLERLPADTIGQDEPAGELDAEAEEAEWEDPLFGGEGRSETSPPQTPRKRGGQDSTGDDGGQGKGSPAGAQEPQEEEPEEEEVDENLPPGCPFVDNPILVQAWNSARTIVQYKAIIGEIDTAKHPLEVWLATWMNQSQYPISEDPGEVMKTWQSKANDATQRALVKMAKWWDKEV